MLELLSALDQGIPRRILVLGDVILDRYTWGAADRVSPEAPTVVLRVDQTEVRLGGAGAVAGLLRALDVEVTLAGLVGDDVSGRAVRRLLDDGHVDQELLLTDVARPTTTKERFLGRAPHRTPHQILRVDHEATQDIPADMATVLSSALANRLGQYDALLISDYAKGTCSENLVATAIDQARAAGVPVLVDPARRTDYRRYRGATVLKPNRSELGLATGLPIERADDAVRAARQLRDQAACQAVVVTLDRDGMAVVTASEPEQVFATHAREVTDITGAGDTALAVLGWSVAHRWPLAVGARLANVAAGIQVAQVGIAPVKVADIRRELVAHRATGKIVDLATMAGLAPGYRRDGRRLVCTNGCFDLLHVGHVTYLQEAAALGDVLLVAINSDQSVRALKGPHRPVIGQHDRAALLAALECVDHVLVFDDPTPHALLAAIRPDILVKGGDYGTEEVVGREVVLAYGGEVRVTGRVAGISTTELLRGLSDHAKQSVESTVAASEKVVG